MNSKSKSSERKSSWLGNNFPIWVLVLFALVSGLVGCRSSAPRATDPRVAEKPKDYSEIPMEYSLKEDRALLDQARQEIPEETQRDNDELAFVLKLMGEVKERPDRVRDRWNSEVRKRREKFQNMNRKDREGFNDLEKREREKFLKALNKERDAYTSKKATSEERREFFNEQETKRKEFFANQTDRRKDFDSEMRQRSSDFEAYMRDRQSEFNAEHRAYSERYRQWEKEKRDFEDKKKKYDQEKRQQNASAPPVGNVGATGGVGQGGLSVEDEALLREFENLPKGPKSPLGAGDQ